jgi:hypothetical protein
MKFRALIVGLSLLVLAAVAAYWVKKAREPPADPRGIQLQRDNLKIG